MDRSGTGIIRRERNSEEENPEMQVVWAVADLMKKMWMTCQTCMTALIMYLTTYSLIRRTSSSPKPVLPGGEKTIRDEIERHPGEHKQESRGISLSTPKRGKLDQDVPEQQETR